MEYAIIIVYIDGSTESMFGKFAIDGESTISIYKRTERIIIPFANIKKIIISE